MIEIIILFVMLFAVVLSATLFIASLPANRQALRDRAACLRKMGREVSDKPKSTIQKIELFLLQLLTKKI